MYLDPKAPIRGQIIRAKFLNKLADVAKRVDTPVTGGGLVQQWLGPFNTQLVNSAPQATELKIVKLDQDIIPSISTDESDGVHTPMCRATVQQGYGFSESGEPWSTTGEQIVVFDPYGLPYDADSIQIVWLHKESGRWVLIPQMTVRAVRIVNDVDGTFPGETSGESTDPTTYPCRFVDLSFTEEAGSGSVTVTNKGSSSLPHAYVANLGDATLAEGDVVMAFWQQGRWYTIEEGETVPSTTSQQVVTNVVCNGDGTITVTKKTLIGDFEIGEDAESSSSS